MRQGLLARLRGGDGRLIAALMAYAMLLASFVGGAAPPAAAAQHPAVTCLTPSDHGQPASHGADHCDWCFAGTAPALEATAPALAAGVSARCAPAALLASAETRLRLGAAAQPSRGPPLDA